MKYNPNKTVSAGSKRIIISYTDSRKHHSIFYDNRLHQLQTEGNKKDGKNYQHIGTNVDDLLHQQMYRRAIYGLQGCSPEEISKLTFQEKRDITILQNKVQNVLNDFKQEMAHSKLGSFLTTFFKRSTFAKAMAHYEDFRDEEEKNLLQFRDLGISKDMIIDRLIQHQLLPENFKQPSL